MHIIWEAMKFSLTPFALWKYFFFCSLLLANKGDDE
jgi:hypothetical protein